MESGLSLLAAVLPLALGAALSPTFLLMQVVVLTAGPGSLARGWALALGSMTMLSVISLGGLSLLARLPDFASGVPSLAEAVILMAAGGFLLGFGIVRWRRPPHPRPGRSRFAEVVDARPPVLFGVGALRMATNASTLALYIPALHAITHASAPLAAKVLSFAILFLLTETAVLAPVLAVTIRGDAAKPYLNRIHDYIEAHEQVMVIVASLGFGAVMVAIGIRILVQL